MSLTVTINGEDVTDKVVINPMPSHKVTGSFRASGAWSLGPFMAHPAVQPGWKFGDVLIPVKHPELRVMYINNDTGVIIYDPDPTPFTGDIVSMSGGDWELAPEPDD